MRYLGRITRWNDDRGYGFILPNMGGEAVFLHINGIAAERAGNDAVYELVMSVAEGSREIGAIADDLRQLMTGGSQGEPPVRPASR